MTQNAKRSSVPSDAQLFVSFYDRAVGELFRYFHRATAGDRKTAEDLVQETFMASLKAFRSGQLDAVTMPWLMGVARHKLVDHYRKVAREERKLSMAYTFADSQALGSTFDDVDAGEALALLDSLPPGQRLVLLLRYVDDLSVSEVARLTGKSVRAAESLIVRARHTFEARVLELRNV